MFENDGELPFKKKAKKKMAKKSDHKHVYEIREEDDVFGQIKVQYCTVCGRKGNTFFTWGNSSFKK